MPIRFAQQYAKRFALLTALLLLAAQTIAVQHVHADAAETFCVVCASSVQDSNLPPPAPLLPATDSDQAARTPTVVAAPHHGKRTLHQARAPPSL